MVIAKPNRKKKDSSFFLARIQPMKSHGLFVYYSPPNFLFLSINEFSFPYHAGDLQVARRGCKPQIAILSCSQINPFFAREIGGSLYVSDQHINCYIVFTIQNVNTRMWGIILDTIYHTLKMFFSGKTTKQLFLLKYNL